MSLPYIMAKWQESAQQGKTEHCASLPKDNYSSIVGESN